MGYLEQGVWKEGWYDTTRGDGEFRRDAAAFRRFVSPAGGDFPAEPGRYRLYVSLACPWAQRTLIFRVLKGLEQVIPVSVVDPLITEGGWRLSGRGGEFPDPAEGVDFLHQLYTLAKPDYSGRVTVPVLWDRETRTIVSNESAEILRMLNSAFDACTASRADYYPAELRGEIDAINGFVYEQVNNGVYRAGFAGTQAAYEGAVGRLFGALDELEARLATRRYLLGGRLTEADWRLFTTLIRFDAVYHGHFKCNLRRVEDYPNLSGHLRELFQVPGIAATVNMDHIKRHYYGSHLFLNPRGIVPLGPELNFARPHGRGHLPVG